jgi:RNA polymerase sporulation-specific sigma factor
MRQGYFHDDTKETLRSLDGFRDFEQDEPALWAAYHRSRSTEDRNKIIAYHIRIVLKLAKKYHRKITVPTSLYFADFVSWGTMGLIHAIENFIPSKGWKFSTYAFNCVQGYILTGVRKFAGINSSGNEKQRFFHSSMIALTPELEQHLGFRDTDLFERIEEEHSREMMSQFKSTLDERETRVLTMRYEVGMTYAEIGFQLQVTRERVRQILLHIEDKIKDKFGHLFKERKHELVDGRRKNRSLGFIKKKVQDEPRIDH